MNFHYHAFKYLFQSKKMYLNIPFYLTNFKIEDYKTGQKRLQIGAALGLQIGARKDYKSGQLKRLQIGAKRLQNGTGITNRGKRITNWGRDYKSGQGLQIGAAQH